MSAKCSICQPPLPGEERAAQDVLCSLHLGLLVSGVEWHELVLQPELESGESAA